eukprot:1837476-Pyramimonas_sp.AAC.1
MFSRATMWMLGAMVWMLGAMVWMLGAISPRARARLTPRGQATVRSDLRRSIDRRRRRYGLVLEEI